MRKALTVAELKSLLLMRFEYEQRKQAKLGARLQRKLGIEERAEEPELIDVKKKLMNWIGDLLARRLKQNRRTTPLISSREFTRFSISLINELVKGSGGELEAEERKMLDNLIKTLFEKVYEAVSATVLPRKNVYDEYWRWVTTVLDLAAERSIQPTEVLAVEERADEITRRMFTKRQFVSLFKKSKKRFLEADLIKKQFFQPMLDVLTEDDEEGRRELEQELETKVMPQLRKTMLAFRLAIDTWCREEVERIYAVSAT
jgi:hypothetical protein